MLLHGEQHVIGKEKKGKTKNKSGHIWHLRGEKYVEWSLLGYYKKALVASFYDSCCIIKGSM